MSSSDKQPVSPFRRRTSIQPNSEATTAASVITIGSLSGSLGINAGGLSVGQGVSLSSSSHNSSMLPPASPTDVTAVTDDDIAHIFPSFQRRKSTWDDNAGPSDGKGRKSISFGPRRPSLTGNPQQGQSNTSTLHRPQSNEVSAAEEEKVHEREQSKSKTTDADISKVIKDLKTGRLQAAARFNADNMSPFARMVAAKAIGDNDSNGRGSTDSISTGSKDKHGVLVSSRDNELSESKMRLDVNGSSFSLSSVKDQVDSTVTIQQDGTPILTCFPRSSSGLFSLKPGIEFQAFKGAYTDWRGAMISALEKQVDYPLITPIQVKGLASENFL